MLDQLRKARKDYPSQFWTLFFGQLINSAGQGMFFPFITLYMTQYLKFSMTDVGVFFGVYSIVSMITLVIGGGLVDRWGRKPVMLLGLYGGALATLVLSASSLIIGPESSFRYSGTIALMILFGLTGNIFAPAINAMVADIIPKERNTEAFGLLRVSINIGISVGPALGGLIASRSYLVLFLCAAGASALYGLIITLFVRETRPLAAPAAARAEPVRASLGGYGRVLTDRIFMVFYGLFLLAIVIYSQSSTTLPVYLRNEFGVNEATFGLMMSTNALMVVLFQYPLSAWISRYSTSLMMALGMALFAVGFGLFAFVGAVPLLFLAQAIWTLGEMIASPLSQSFVANIAPEDMRGRYMGVSSLTWVVGYGIGPLLGGVVMDRISGRAIWYGALILNSVAGLGYLLAIRPIQAALKARRGQLPATAQVASGID